MYVFTSLLCDNETDFFINCKVENTVRKGEYLIDY